MHEGGRYLGVSSDVHDNGEHVNVQGSPHGDGDEGEGDEVRFPTMVVEGEHRDADVAEDEVLGEEIEEFEEGFGGEATVGGQVVEGVVGLADAAEQHCHDTWAEFFLYIFAIDS